MNSKAPSDFSYSDLFSLTDKHAVITGGGSGIGFAIAEALAAVGAKVTLVGRRAEVLEDAAKRIQKDKQVAAQTYVCDLTELDALDHHAKTLAAKCGNPDILVNAAGWRTREAAEEITPEVWRATIDTNLSAPFFLTRAWAAAMGKRGWGKILNIASLQSRLAFEGGIAYGAAKGGIAQLTRAMAVEWSAHGVTANAIAPGFFRTALTETLFADSKVAGALAARTAIGRNGELTDLVGAAIFLCTPASDYITGQILYVDGGFTVK